MFAKTEEQAMAIESLRRYLDQEVEPAFRAHGEQHIPKDLMIGWTRRLTEFGLVSAPIRPELGGLGLGWLTHVMLLEEVGYTSMDVAAPVMLNALAASTISLLAPPHLQTRYLPELLAGNILASFGVSEPGVGSDAAGVQTRARRDGDDWVIKGEKTWITNGGHSDILLCTCRSEEGLTQILVDRYEHGYETREIRKMALNGHSTAQVFLDDVRVRVSNTIGQTGAALKQTLIF